MKEFSLNPGKSIFKTSSIFSDVTRKAIFSVLKNIKHGCLVIEEGSEQRVFGELSSQEDLKAHIMIQDPKVYKISSLKV